MNSIHTLWYYKNSVTIVLHDNNWMQWLILVHMWCLHIQSHIVHVLESVNEHSVVHTLVLPVTICNCSLEENCFALWCADTCWLSVSFLFRVVSTCNEGRRLGFTVQASCYKVSGYKVTYNIQVCIIILNIDSNSLRHHVMSRSSLL